MSTGQPVDEADPTHRPSLPAGPGRATLWEAAHRPGMPTGRLTCDDTPSFTMHKSYYPY